MSMFAKVMPTCQLSGSVRLCPGNLVRAGQIQSQCCSGFAGFCPACPDNFQLPYVTRAQGMGFKIQVKSFLNGLGSSFLSGQAGQKREVKVFA